jgi:DNA-binding response OmpR family regulator
VRIEAVKTRHNRFLSSSGGSANVSRILVVEDNEAYAEEVIAYLKERGHDVCGASTGATMWKLLGNAGFDIVLLDLGLPDQDGSELIHQLRLRHLDIGIIVVTARVRHNSRVEALMLGADHYLTKPLKLSELNAIITTLERRLPGATSPARVAGWILNTGARELLYADEAKVKLSERECSFLALLSRSPQGISREATLHAMGDELSVDSRRLLDMLVYRLRKKVQQDMRMDIPVQSIYGGGYSLTASCLVRGN